MKISPGVFPLTLCFLIACFLNISESFAQETDFQTWSSIEIRKSVTKKLDASLSQELRLKDNSTRLNSTFTDIGVKYELLKNLDAGIYYRFIVSPDAVAHRPYAEVSYEIELDKWSLEPRLRIQHQEQQNEIAKNYFRPKVTLNYKINKKWKPFFAGELFYHAFYYKGSEFDEYRLSTGIEYDFHKRHSLKFSYLLSQEFNVNNALLRHVLGVAYQYNF